MEVQSRTARHLRAGIRHCRLSFVPGAADQRARGDPPERAAHDGVGAVVAHLHGQPGQAVARDAHEVRVPAADGARLCGDGAVQRAAEEASGLLVQGGDAQSDQSAQPRRRLGGRRRQHLPQYPGDDRGDRRARHAGGPLALPVAADPDQEQAVPRLPQHRRSRAQDDARPLRQRERLRLEDGRGDRRADRVGADDRADRARAQPRS